MRTRVLSIAIAVAFVVTAVGLHAQPVPEKATPTFITQQPADQLLMSKFKGTDVIGSNNEKIGDVYDVLFALDGRIYAYVIGIGGFLGIGTKDVALPPSAFQVLPATQRDDMKLKLNMTRGALKNAPEFIGRRR